MPAPALVAEHRSANPGSMHKDVLPERHRHREVCPARASMEDRGRLIAADTTWIEPDKAEGTWANLVELKGHTYQSSIRTWLRISSIKGRTMQLTVRLSSTWAHLIAQKLQQARPGV